MASQPQSNSQQQQQSQQSHQLVKQLILHSGIASSSLAPLSTHVPVLAVKKLSPGNIPYHIIPYHLCDCLIDFLMSCGWIGEWRRRVNKIITRCLLLFYYGHASDHTAMFQLLAPLRTIPKEMERSSLAGLFRVLLADVYGTIPYIYLCERNSRCDIYRCESNIVSYPSTNRRSL
jgi:hypothetical protein